MDESDDTPDHLGGREREFYWDWSRENPVEIVLVAFILIMFFALPRTGCGIDKSEGDFSVRPAPESSGDAKGEQR